MATVLDGGPMDEKCEFKEELDVTYAGLIKDHWVFFQN